VDLYQVIRALLEERKRLDNLIQALEDVARTGGVGRISSRRGRKFMDGPARREVSERMKQYWAKRREERSREIPETDPK
jgi:hypothetical protein